MEDESYSMSRSGQPHLKIPEIHIQLPGQVVYLFNPLSEDNLLRNASVT